MTNGNQHPTRRRRTTAAVLSHTLLAAAALGVGYWYGKRVTEPPPSTSLALASTGIVPRTSPLHEVLETLPSGAERTIERDLNATPVTSYVAISGVWCRRFELRASTGRTDAVACRGDEEWRIAALATGPNEEPEPIVGIRRPPETRTVIVDTAVNATMEGEPLDLQDELVVLVNGWESAVEP
jgi:hypothetical protein